MKQEEAIAWVVSQVATEERAELFAAIAAFSNNWTDPQSRELLEHVAQRM